MIKICKFVIWLLCVLSWAILSGAITEIFIAYFPAFKLIWSTINVACATLFGAVTAEYIMNSDYEWWKYKRARKGGTHG